MRFILLTLAALLPVGEACAADLGPTLFHGSLFEPGTPRTMDWRGVYFGGQYGYGSGHADFTKATESLIAYALRFTTVENEQHVSQWNVLGSADDKSSSFGGFLGYNYQWEDAIVGFELNYSKSYLNIVAPNTPLTRQRALKSS